MKAFGATGASNGTDIASKLATAPLRQNKLVRQSSDAASKSTIVQRWFLKGVENNEDGVATKDEYAFR